MEHSCVSTLPPDQEEALAWQRQSGPGAERDSWSCVGMVSTGTGSGVCWAETVQRDIRESFLVLFVLIERYHELELNGRKVTSDDFLNNHAPITSIFFVFCIFVSTILNS